MAHIAHDAVRLAPNFSTREYAIIAELLQIAQAELVTNADTLSLRHPDAHVVTRLRAYASHCADYRDRIQEVLK